MKNNLEKNYIITFYEPIRINTLLQEAKNVCLKIVDTTFFQHQKLMHNTEFCYDGIIYESLGLLYLKTTLKQVHYLLKNRATNKYHIALEDNFSSLSEPSIETKPNTTNNKYSWGINYTHTHNKAFTGKGVNVAILDTGIDAQHPDFAHAQITATSFIENESEIDGNGHGTHCAGLIVGKSTHPEIAQYGVAPDVHLFSGKVLRNSGTSHSRYLYLGIEWALQNQCKVISISLGNRVRRGVCHSIAFEKAAKTAIKKGALIIASAGNDSYRHLQRLLPVSEPANCPSIMAVGAINSQYKMYNRSNASINPDGGHIDLVAPGVGMQSSYLQKGYKILSGTSMATSFVTGITAQYIEAFPDKTPKEIHSLLLKNTMPLLLPKKDVGKGLVQSL